MGCAKSMNTKEIHHDEEVCQPLIECNTEGKKPALQTAEILPNDIMDIIYDYLNTKDSFLSEYFIVHLCYNNGLKSLLNGLEIVISFKRRIKDLVQHIDHKENERVGLVMYRLTAFEHRSDKYYLRGRPMVFEISSKKYPRCLMRFMNCDKHKATKQLIQDVMIDNADNEDCIDCIELKLKSDLDTSGNMKYFRRSILIPNDELLHYFSLDKDDNPEFAERNEYGITRNRDGFNFYNEVTETQRWCDCRFLEYFALSVRDSL